MLYLNDATPDLVVSDLHMPEQDGFALLRQIKAIPRLANIPFVIISSTAWGGKDRTTAQQLGAARFLLRPIEAQLLLDEIRACILESRA